MSDTAVARQRRRPPSNDSPPPHAHGHDDAVGSNNGNTDVILSLRNEQYKQIMWKQFNILGKTRDNAREENVAYELWTQFRNKKEGTTGAICFYTLDRGGKNRLRVEENEALEKITRDIKRRIETVQKWYGKSSSSATTHQYHDNTTTMNKSEEEVPSVSEDISESSGEQKIIEAGKSIIEKPPPEERKPPPPSSSVECDVDSSAQVVMHCSAAEQLLSSKKSQQEQHHDTKLPPSSISSPGDDTSSPQPNENDTILSLYDPKYRNVMFQCFQELGKVGDSSSSKKNVRDAGVRIVAGFKEGGGRFFKVARGGKVYTEITEGVAMQKIMGDIGRRHETCKRWNLVIASQEVVPEGKPLYEGGNNDIAAEQQFLANEVPASLLQEELAELANSSAMNPSPVIDLMQAGMGQASVVALAAAAAAISSYPTDILPQETSVMDLNPVIDFPQAGIVHASVPAEDTTSSNPTGIIPQEKTAPSPTNIAPQRQPTDPEQQAPVAVAAAAQSSNCQVGCQLFELQAEEKKQDDHYDVGSSSAVVRTSSALEPQADHDVGSPSEANSSVGHYAGSPSEAHSSVGHAGRSPSEEAELKSGEAPLEMIESQPFHAILSLNDDYYRTTMWKYYKILGKVRDNVREAQIGNEVFSLLKQNIGNTGKFFKCVHGQNVEVDDEKALAKIIADIRRRMKNYRKWSDSPEKPPAKPKPKPKPSRLPSLNSPVGKSPPQPPSSSRRVRQPRTPASENKSTASKMSPRRSSRKPTPDEAAKPTPDEAAENNAAEPGDEDVVLSLNDEKYKQVMWKQYNILGTKQPGDKIREEGVANQIFQSLRRSLARRGGRFFKKMSHGDVVFVVDDEGALQKITRDLKRRNESIHKWLIRDSRNQQQEQEQPSLPPVEAMADYQPPSITQDHAWRDQLVPSPINAVANYHLPQPIAHVHMRVDTNYAVDKKPVSTETIDEKLPSLPQPNHDKVPPPKPKHVRKSNAKSILEKLISSHLGQRLPPLKTIPTIKSVQTPNQLIQMLQRTTHKLNELHGTHIKHCKVLRLYNLSELHDNPKSVATKAPSLAQVAEYMETTPKSLKKCYVMYQNAVMRAFKFEKFGEHKIQDHYGVFFGTEEGFQLQLSKCGEHAMQEYFEQVGKRVVQDAENANAASDPNKPYNIFAGAPEVKAEQWKGTETPRRAHTQTTNNVGVRQTCRNKKELVTKYNENLSYSDHKNPFFRNFERNKARLAELWSINGGDANSELSAIQLSTTAKRVKRGIKDRMLCMVAGCEKHAQTRCYGCCTSHHRILSSTAGSGNDKNVGSGKDKKKPPQATASSANKMCVAQLPSKNDLEQTKIESSITLGKRKSRDLVVETSSPKNYSVLSKLEPGSRIYVEWDGDNSLYKATVKKMFFDREVPMAKIHYDGKKRHILDTIPLEMVNGFIEGENEAVKQKHASHEVQSLPKSQETEGNVDITSNFPRLQKLYPGTVPTGMPEITQPCPELGSGWSVNVVTRKGQLDGIRTDRYFIAPSGKRFRSVPEVERYYWQNPIEFGGISSDVSKSMPHFMDERLDEECQEISAINHMHLMVQQTGDSNLSMGHHSMSAFSSSYSPIYAQRGSNFPSGMRSLITISPITTQSAENCQLSADSHAGLNGHAGQGAVAAPTLKHPSSLPPSASTSLHCLKPGASTVRHGIQCPKEVVAVGNGVLNSTKNVGSAFAPSARVVRPPLHHQLYQTSSSTPNRTQFPGMRSASVARLQNTPSGPTHTSSSTDDGTKNAETGTRRPKRKLKPVTRFEEENGPVSRRATQSGQSKSVLCHCPECAKGDLSVQGIYAHYGRAHSGKKLSWLNVTYSCPFCPLRTPTSRIFRSFGEVEAHVNASHIGCELVGPHPSKLSGQSTRVHICPSKLHQPTGKSDRVLRDRKATLETSGYAAEKGLHEAAPEVVAEQQGPPSWAKIEYVHLLPDGRKEYPRTLCRVIDMIDEQCQTQGETVEVAREQRLRLCRNEVETETRALDEERLSYQRGIRERSRLADAERIEKQKFTEKQEQMLMRYQYENRNRKRNQEDVEADKLCSRPIRFSSETARHNTRQGKACDDDECQFCKKDKSYLHHLLLDSEMREFNMGAPATETPVFQQSTKLLNPSFRIINDDFFAQGGATADLKDDGTDASGSKRVNQSRRDASTAKRLKTEEGKLWMLKNTKHSLEFIKKYNNGMISNAWGEVRKDNRGHRKSY